MRSYITTANGGSTASVMPVVTITACVFSGNSAYQGGAIFFQRGSSGYIIGSSFTTGTLNSCSTTSGPSCYGGDVYSNSASVYLTFDCPGGYIQYPDSKSPWFTGTFFDNSGGANHGNAIGYPPTGNPITGGYPSILSTSCLSCVPGQYIYFNPTSNIYTCNICGLGMYQDAANQVTCKTCPAGSYNTDSGTTITKHDSQWKCTVCPANTYLIDPATNSALHQKLSDCSYCPSGTYIADQVRRTRLEAL